MTSKEACEAQGAAAVEKMSPCLSALEGEELDPSQLKKRNIIHPSRI
jgi:hypothetical protein